MLDSLDQVSSGANLARNCAVANFLTVDVEEYFHVNYAACDTSALRDRPANLDRQIDTLLSIFADAGIRCTFFTLGEAGEKYPGAIGRIHAAGHELASHGYGHKAIREMTPNEFRQDLQRSCGVLEALTGEKVLGFRAPSFSVDTDSLPWFYDTLEERGLSYSSSVFPGRTFLYGIPGFSQEPHRPVVGERASRVIEFPITGFELFGRRYPLYVRLLSAAALKRRLLAANRDARPGILYVHPREIDPEQPRLPLSRAQALIHYWGVAGCETKLRELTRYHLQFGTMRDYLAALPNR